MYKVFITYKVGHPEYVSEVDTYEEAFAKAVHYLQEANSWHFHESVDDDDPEPNSAIIYKHHGHVVAEIYSPY